MIRTQGFLSKLDIKDSNPLAYSLCLEKQHPIELNNLIGKSITIRFLGEIKCIYCHRAIKKSFNGGYCYVCFKTLARCDQCIIKPELCHYHLGTCREPDWGKRVCMQNHIVYFSYTSGIKVGITRKKNLPNRWFDQGATLGLPIFEVKTRLLSGLLEVSLKSHFNDKTNWRKMLSDDHYETDLKAMAESFFQSYDLSDHLKNHPHLRSFLPKALYPHHQQTTIHYPQIDKLQKVSSFNADKNPIISGTLIGMKGQYLIFNEGVINIKKYQGYHIEFYEDNS